MVRATIQCDRIITYIVAVAAILLTARFGADAFAQQPPPEAQGPSVVDLGERQAGEQYEVSIGAINDDCADPQDFRFELFGMPWMNFAGTDRADGVAIGQTGTVPVILDFTNIAPGTYQGVINVYCETCGFFVFGSRCRIENRQINVAVTVVLADPPEQPEVQAGDAPGQGEQDPASPGEDQPAQGHGDIPGAESAASQVVTYDPPDVPDVDDEIREDLRGSQRRGIENAQHRANAAIEKAKTMTARLNAQKKKCKDCWDEVARLETIAKAKQAAADQAKSAADQAEQAAQDAEEHHKNYRKDLNAAKTKMRSTARTLQMQAAARTAIRKDYGEGSSQYAEADAKVDTANDAAIQAQRDFSAVRASKQARRAAAQQARANANAAKKAAENAQEDADDAKAAVDRKRKECETLDKVCAKAKSDADAAAANAVAMTQKVQDKVDAANAQAADNLREDITKKKAECERIEKEWDKKIRQMTGALNALEQTGYFEAGQFSDSKAAPDKLWTSYKRLGLNAAMKSANITGAQITRVITGSGAKSRITGPLYDALLKSLQVAYGVAAIRQSELTPGTYAHGRTEGKALRDWLRDNNHAWTDQDGSDAREVEEEMRKIMQDRNYVAEQMARGIQALENCKRELAAMEEKLAKATGK